MTAALRAISGYLEGRLLWLPSDRSVTVGTSLESDLVLAGEQVSRCHCRVEPKGSDSHVVEAIRNAAVRFRNGRVAQLELQDGDTFGIGDNDFVYVAAADSNSEENRAFTEDRRLLASRDLESYRILRKVQMNEIAVTYMGAHKQTGERISIRLFKTEHLNNKVQVQRFLSQAMVGMTLNHPRFAETIAIGSAHGSCFVVSELIEDNLKLERFLRDRAPLDLNASLSLVRSLAQALIYARKRKVIVGRRKASGIYVLRDLRIKVSHFDLTAELEDSLCSTQAYQDFLGEKFAVEGKFETSEEHSKLNRVDREPKSLSESGDEGVDIMLLGRTLYQLLCGLIFQAKAATKHIIEGYGKAVASESGKFTRSGPLAGIPRNALMVLARMVTADPKKRFGSVAEADEALLKILTAAAAD